jgi:hypothetical protein
VRYALTLIGAHVIGELNESLQHEEGISPAQGLSAARVEAVVVSVVGREGLTVVTGHGKSQEGGEAAAALPTSIRALCKEGIIAKGTKSGVEENGNKRSRPAHHKPSFNDPSPWHHPLAVHEIPGNDGAFVVPLSDVTAVAIGCIYGWRAHRKRDSNVRLIEPNPDAAAVAMVLLRSRAL